MATADRVGLLQERISAALSPTALEIVDDSHRHAGHEGAKSGGGHYNVRVVSEAFRGKALLERHRLVYAAVGDAMNREVHALSIQAQTPEEAAAD